MRILLVHNFYQQPGGEDEVFAAEGKLLESAGHEVHRFTMDNDAIDSMSKLQLARRTIWNAEPAERIARLVREHRIEIAHFHNTFPLISPAAYSAARSAGAAVVQTLHNFRLLCPAATFFRAGRVCEDCVHSRLLTPAVRHKCYRDNRGATAVLGGMLLAHRALGTWRSQIDRYIALSQFARDKFIASGFNAQQIAIKPNFLVDDPGIGAGAGGFALFVGRLTEKKGVRRLIIVGDGPLRNEVCDAVSRNQTIEYLGRQPMPRVLELMGDARALVFPSQWYEGQPRTIVESFARGTPVLASDLGTMREMIIPNETGWRVPSGDVESLGKSLENLFDERISLDPMRVAARARFERDHSADRNLMMLLDIYHEARRRRAAA
ncbi:MAG TPA: glycosyltransferase [Tepidisphaeraceae bacterium]|nr:glycosyltransferase [Tepidisphaeraceae bacterium]